jgi:hypothetical protein
MLLELSEELRDALPEGVDPFECFLEGNRGIYLF